jgi:hypothetical protein
MIEDAYTINAAPPEYRRLYYAYLFENPGLNTEKVMSAAEFVRFYQENVERPSRLDTL